MCFTLLRISPRALLLAAVLGGGAPGSIAIAQQHDHGGTQPPPSPGAATGASARTPAGPAQRRAGAAVQRITRNGVTAEFSVGPAGSRTTSTTLPEHGEGTVRLTLRNARTGKPLAGAAPATWIDWREGRKPTSASACRERVDGFVRANAFMEGSLKSRAVVDLNSYFVISLNRSPTISVLDPFLGFGRTKLYTTVPLPAPGSSWVLGADERRLYVTMPLAGRVGVVDTDRWRLLTSIEVGARPTYAALQPGGRYLWIVAAADDSASAGGLVVIDTDADTVVARLAAGRGPHTLAFTQDGAAAAITNGAAGTVTMIDAAARRVVAEVPTGQRPVDVAWSEAGRLMYVAHEGDGTIVALEPSTGRIATRITTRPGLRTIRFAPAPGPGHHGHGGGAPGAAGRLGFVLNPRENLVHVVDGTTRTVVRTTEIPHGPDEVAFTGSFAYVRAAGSSDIAMIPLADPSAGGVGKLDRFPVGNKPVGAAGPLADAATIVTAPDMPDAVYVLNAAERMIYYFHYMEGMPMPSGGLTTYGYEPTAIMVVGKDMRERAPGEYSATVRLSRQGDYDLILLLPEPRMIACFPFSVVANPALGEKRARLEVSPAMPRQEFTVGSNVLRLQLTNPVTREPWRELRDAAVSVASPTGWSTRRQLRAVEDGVYETPLDIPAAGVYFVSIEVPSLGIGLRDRRPLVLRAPPPPAAK